MNQYSSNSASFPVFIDGTSSAVSSSFNESTAPSDNLASIKRALAELDARLQAQRSLRES